MERGERGGDEGEGGIREGEEERGRGEGKKRERGKEIKRER